MSDAYMPLNDQNFQYQLLCFIEQHNNIQRDILAIDRQSLSALNVIDAEVKQLYRAIDELSEEIKEQQDNG